MLWSYSVISSVSGFRELSLLRGLKKRFHLLPAGSLTNGGFIWAHGKAYTVNRPMVSCLVWILYWIGAILERLIPPNVAVNRFLVCPLKKVPWPGCVEERKDREGKNSPALCRNIEKYKLIPLLVLDLVQIHTVRNDIICLPNDPIIHVNKSNFQNLDFCLPQPKSKLVWYVPSSASQNIIDSIQFNYSIQGKVLIMGNRLMC